MNFSEVWQTYIAVWILIVYIEWYKQMESHLNNSVHISLEQ